MDITVLEHDGGVAEDEIDGSGDETLDEELTVRVDVESVLVSQHVATVESGEIGTHTESHRLMLGRTRRVLESYVTR